MEQVYIVYKEGRHPYANETHDSRYFVSAHRTVKKAKDAVTKVAKENPGFFGDYEVLTLED